MAEVVAMLNQKGGVGKTSTCHNLGGVYARRGLRVLLVDNDPQASLTQGLLGPAPARGLDPAATLAAVYGQGTHAGGAIRPTGFAGLDLLPGHRDLADFNLPRPHEAPLALQLALADALAAVAGAYDLVLVDCPPNLHLCSWAALAAAGGVVVPLQPEDYGAQGVLDVRDSIRWVREAVNPALRTLGLLVSMWNATRSIHQLFDETLRAEYGELVFAARVPDAAVVPEAISMRTPLSFYKPRSAASRALEAVADELWLRLDAAGRAEAA